ncbi:hypothetical protein PH210_06435 [Paenibacillus sp. BSR1-1]|uniref:hypothetical protein n=1 Tax=Paenibacillus sp. BSR1-1 TaxID=3020845 RepID=UPI0025B1E6A3|nr:hypothetical protein [Paenibacillus sp. BSR1-1]MDN3015844.1 hypothetical protein [Paenibacillus sp. BSR1-1]
MNETIIKEITKLVLLKLEEHDEAFPLNKNENNITSFKNSGKEHQPYTANPKPLSNEEIKLWDTISSSLNGGNDKILSNNKPSAITSLEVSELKKWEEVAAIIRKTASQNEANTEGQVKLYTTFY